MQRRRILFVAFHFPPVQGSSGIQRTLKFATYLRDHGWDPMVLTVSPRAYERTTPDQLGDIPSDMIVERAFGLDTSRHLSIKGRYFRFMAQPDRYASWWPAAVLKGRAMIRKYKPEAIFATYPIATAHQIGLSLHRASGLPFIADFRDAMTEPGYPRDPMTWASNRKLEEQVVRNCTKALFTAPGTMRMYAERYADVPASRWAVIENGFDEENFREAEIGLERTPLGNPGQCVLLHSGIVYPKERDPRPMFEAIKQLKAEGKLTAEGFKLLLRAPGNEGEFRAMIAAAGIEDLVTLEPPMPYRKALGEMIRADGLLLMQGRVCNHQIPAKLYEYARAGTPVLGLTDPTSDTADRLRAIGAAQIADIDDVASIRDGIEKFVGEWRARALQRTGLEVAMAHSRRSRAQVLSRVLEELLPQAPHRSLSSSAATP
jgi:glycosyltransferase involved in cell wall biosynthesis